MQHQHRFTLTGETLRGKEGVRRQDAGASEQMTAP
jgi:hypothetical protein